MMKVKIKQWNSQAEADAVEKFLTWQCIRSHREDQCADLLLYTKGRPGCCVIIEFENNTDKEVVIPNFKQLIQYWEEKGLWLI